MDRHRHHWWLVVVISLLSAAACVGSDAETVNNGTPSTNNDGGLEGGADGDGGNVGPAAIVPTGVDFWDADPAVGTVGGPVHVRPAVDETNVAQYKLYWASDDADQPNANAKKPIGDPIAFLIAPTLTFDLPLSSHPPVGATSILAVAVRKSDQKEEASGASGAIKDLSPIVTDPSSSASWPFGDHDHCGIDTAIAHGPNADLFLAMGASPTTPPTPSLVTARCTSTTNADCTVASYSRPASRPAIAVDTTKSRYVVVSEKHEGANHSLVFTNAPFTGLAGTETSVAIGNYEYASLALTEKGSVIVVANAAATGMVTMFRCNADASSCPKADLNVTAAPAARPSIHVDAAHHQVLISVEKSIIRCDADGETCTDVPIAQLPQAWTGATSVLDRKDDVLTLVGKTNDSKPVIIRCPLAPPFSGQGCNTRALAIGDGFGAPYHPAVAVDEASRTLYVAGENLAAQGHLFLIRCSADGSVCAKADLSGAAQGDSSGKEPSMVLDKANFRVHVVARKDPALHAFLYTYGM